LVSDLQKRADDARTARDTRERELQACRLRYSQIGQALQRANAEVDRTQKLALAVLKRYKLNQQVQLNRHYLKHHQKIAVLNFLW
jgi:hypothetical protein